MAVVDIQSHLAARNPDRAKDQIARRLQAMVAEMNKELAGRADFETAREWHNQMVRMRGAVAAIGNARFGYAWAKEEAPGQG